MSTIDNPLFRVQTTVFCCGWFFSCLSVCISMTLVCFSHVSSACITLMFIICLILIAAFCYACCAVCEYKYTVFQKKRDHVFDDKDELELPFITIFAVRCYAYCRHPVSVRPSDTFVSCAKTNKDIFEIFSPSGSRTILVFPYQTGWRWYDENPPNGGVECKGYEKMTIFDQYIALSQKR